MYEYNLNRSTILSVKIPLWLKQELQKLADDMSVSVSEIVRSAILQYIKEQRYIVNSVMREQQQPTGTG